MAYRVRQRVFEILEKGAPGDRASRAFDVFIITMIATNVLAVILETVPALAIRFGAAFRVFEVASVAIFTVEYVLRLWSCTVLERFRRPFRGRLRMALTPLALVDLMAILPFYLPMLLPLDLRFIRAVRMIRLFRLFKVGRYSESLRICGLVLRQKKEQLAITLFVVIIMLVIASSLMYYVEQPAQPEAFSSIPAAMWWGIATLTTVGYGDVCPVTPVGKMLAAVIALLGVATFAMPAGIIASGFTEAIGRRRATARVCPHCGGAIED
jgi:voltage-gated potassium channel